MRLFLVKKLSHYFISRQIHIINSGILILQEQCEFQVDETIRVPEVGVVVGGLLTQGVITEGMNLVIG